MAIVSARERHSEEYCAMYDICGARSDGKVLNCPYGSPSVKVFIFQLVLGYIRTSVLK